jgi:hypothetical protein
MPSAHDHLVNTALLDLVREAAGRRSGLLKNAFVPGGDPSMGAGGGGAPPGAPPGDPSMGGGAPPPDPAAGGGGGGGDPIAALQPMIQQMIQQAMQTAGGAGAGAGGAAGPGLKPKIDVNVELMQIKNMLAKICDQLGVQMPAQDMVATPDKLNAMAQGQSTAAPAPGGGAGGGGAISPVGPVDPMAGAGVPGAEKVGRDHSNGTPFDPQSFKNVSDRAAAIARIRRRPQ